MTSVRSLLTRVAKLEAARVTPKSPIELAYGSLEAFEDETKALMDARKLDRNDMTAVLIALRRWHADKVWGGFRYHRDGTPEYGNRRTGMAVSMARRGCTSTASAASGTAAIPGCWPV